MVERTAFRTLEVGDEAPDLRLPGVDGNDHTLEDLTRDKQALVLVFTCNHCPTAIANEDRIIALQRDYEAGGVQVAAINSNETAGHPTDDFAHMVERAREKGFEFPYLRDESQDVAWAYGALRTPHFFVFGPDRTLAYQGRLDDSPNDPSRVGRQDLREALDELLAGKPVSVPVTKAAGCNVKWWGKDAHWMPV